MTSLDDLGSHEAFARSIGCTAAQVKHAIETVGTEPDKVLAYLQRRGHTKLKDKTSKPAPDSD